LLASQLGDLLRQQVVVENRAGAGGQIAAQHVARSPADGYTLLLGDVGSIAIAPAAFSRLPYDPTRELVGIAEVARVHLLLVVPARSPATNVADFVQAHRGGTNRVLFGTFGAGTSGHFTAIVFGEAAGIKVEAVHFRATGDVITALANGEVAGAFLSTALGAAQVRGGRLRALATTAPQRSTLLPDVPTFAEAGYPRVDITSWFTVLAPTGTPAPILDTLNEQIVVALQSAATRQRIVEAGFSVSGTSRADTDRILRNETQRWAEIVRTSGFRGD
jgi:tripartite-type tricarboxylate transporter receptor subunit TctC